MSRRQWRIPDVDLSSLSTAICKRTLLAPFYNPLKAYYHTEKARAQKIIITDKELIEKAPEQAQADKNFIYQETDLSTEAFKNHQTSNQQRS